MRRARLPIRLGCVLLLAGATAGSSPSSAVQNPSKTYAFVSNERAHTVSVIDTATDTVVRTIDVGPRPGGLQVLGDRLYVALSDDNPQGTTDRDAIARVDVEKGAVLARYHAGSDPEQLVVSPDGQRLYAANEDAGTATARTSRPERFCRRSSSASSPRALRSARMAGGCT